MMKLPGFATLAYITFSAAHKFAAAEDVTATAFNILETAAVRLCIVIKLFCVPKEHASSWALHANGNHFSPTEYCIKHKSLSMCQDLPFSSTMRWTENTKNNFRDFTFILGTALTKQLISFQTLLYDKEFLVFTNQTTNDRAAL